MNAVKDQNNINSLIVALNTDGKTIQRIKVNPSNHAVKISDGATGSDYGPTNALRDDNDVPILMAVSSVDGKTPVAVYGDSNGNLLIQST